MKVSSNTRKHNFYTMVACSLIMLMNIGCLSMPGNRAKNKDDLFIEDMNMKNR
jgi:hypothetical protein